MSEAQMRAELVHLLKPLHAISVENLIGADTPDINLAGAWIECKWARSWPKREDTPLRLPHYTDGQKAWALRRTAAGEESWLALQVKREWFFFDADGSQMVGQLTHQQLCDAARFYFPTKPTSEQLVAIFRPL